VKSSRVHDELCGLREACGTSRGKDSSLELLPLPAEVVNSPQPCPAFEEASMQW